MVTKMIHLKFILFIFLLYQHLLLIAADRRRNIDGAPMIPSDHVVQFYLLEAAYPYNVPDSIVDVMGSSFEDYETPYAGLGVWDITGDKKYTIEFRSNDYVGGLLPDLRDNGVIEWNNQASVKITYPAAKSDWNNAIMITTSTGFAYRQLIDYLHDHKSKWQHYQPVTAVYVSSDDLSADDEVTTKEIHDDNYVRVKAKNSYWFVNKLIKQLNEYGCEVKSFLHIHGTSFAYRLLKDEPASEVHWDDEDEPANPDVYAWYQDLIDCYQSAYNATAYDGDGATYFLQQLQACYGSYAYIYRSKTSVYNVTLYTNATNEPVTPMLVQYTYELPDDDTNDDVDLSPFDISVIVFASLLFCGAGIILVSKFFRRKRRRRVSFEGELAAQRTVETILITADERKSDGRESFKSYYHGSRSIDTGRASFFSNVYSSAVSMVSNRGSLARDSQSSINPYDYGAGSAVPYVSSNGADMSLDESQHRLSSASGVYFNPMSQQRLDEEQAQRQQLLPRVSTSSNKSTLRQGPLAEPLTATRSISSPYRTNGNTDSGTYKSPSLL